MFSPIRHVIVIVAVQWKVYLQSFLCQCSQNELSQVAHVLHAYASSSMAPA
jgi:hypothetical protein